MRKPISDEVKKQLRATAIVEGDWTAIARAFGLAETTVRRVLEATYSWTHTTCRQCPTSFSYRVHVDFPRYYRRCSGCAAKEWYARTLQRRTCQ